MLDALRWLYVLKRLELNALNFIKKMRIGEAPEYLTKQLKYVGEVQPYRLKKQIILDYIDRI